MSAASIAASLPMLPIAIPTSARERTGCIVDAVADKCQLPLSGHLRQHLLDLLHLIRRKQLRVRLINANLRSHRLADRLSGRPSA